MAYTRVLREWEELRILQAAKRPSEDLSGGEVESAVRLSEHLLHLQRSQRASLAAAASAHGDLRRLAAVTGSLADGRPLPPQVRDPLAPLPSPLSAPGRRPCARACKTYFPPLPTAEAGWFGTCSAMCCTKRSSLTVRWG